MLFLKNKKGEFENTLYIYILDFAIVGAILLASLNFINNVEDNTYFDKNYLSKDFALFLSTFIGAPHQISHDYKPEKHTLHDFKFDFSDNRVTVSSSSGSDSSDHAIFYPYASNSFYSNDLTPMDGPSSVFLSFNGNSFSNSDSEITDLGSDACYTNLDTKNPNYKSLKILLNPSFGEDITWDSVKYKKNIMWSLSNSITSNLDQLNFQDISSTSNDIIEYTKLNPLDLVNSFNDYDIIFHLVPVHDSSSNINEITINFNSDSQNFAHNKKLACTIMSGIESESKFSNLDLTINIKSITNPDYFPRLAQDKQPLIIVLEISNLNLPETTSIFNTNHLSLLGYIISKSIVNYHG